VLIEITYFLDFAVEVPAPRLREQSTPCELKERKNIEINTKN